jgi:hypothetical protein
VQVKLHTLAAVRLALLCYFSIAAQRQLLYFALQK